MKRVRGIVCGLLFCLLLNLNMLPALAAPDSSGEAGIITTDLSANDGQVTLNVSVKENAGVTSGKVVVSYDESLLTVSTVNGGNIWQLDDVNTNASVDGKKAVSYAWATTEKTNAAGNMLTITFTAAQAADGKEVSVQTDIEELYDENTPVSVPEKTIVDTVKVTLPQVPAPSDTGLNVADILEKIANAQPGDVIVIPVHDGSTIIPKEVFEALQGKDITLQFVLDNGVVWIVNGKDVTDPRDVNIAVILRTNNIPASAITAIGDDKAKYQLQVTLLHQGELGANVAIMIPLGSEAVGYFANMYYYNPSSQACEYSDTAKVGADGNATLKFSHASDYVILISENDGAAPVSSQNPAQTDAKQMGDSTNMAGYVLLVGAAVVVLAEAVRKKLIHA